MTKPKKLTKKIILVAVSVIVLFLLVLIVNVVVLVRNETVVSQGKPIKTYDTKHYALLVVDIQEIITGKSSIYPGLQKNSEQLITNINRAVDSFSAHHYPVVYIRSEISNPFINLVNDTYAKGSEGVKYDPRLKVVSRLEVVKTSQDSFRKSNLDDILISNKINELYIVGLDAAECVNTTIAAALNRNYKVNIIQEAVISKTERATDSMMVCFKNRGVHLVKLDNLKLKEF